MKQKMQITKVSSVSNIAHTLEIEMDPTDYRKWQAGVVIQLALPYLTAAEREFLMTGITDEEWQELFKDENQTGRGKDIPDQVIKEMFDGSLNIIEEQIKDMSEAMMAMVDRDMRRLPDVQTRFWTLQHKFIELQNAYNRLNRPGQEENEDHE